MKRVVLFLVIIVSLTFNLHAYSIKQEFYIKDGQKQIDITCANGNTTFIYYFTDGHNYWSKGNIVQTLDKAVKLACIQKTSSSIKTVKKGTLYCKTSQSIKQALKSEFSYSMEELGSPENGCGIADKNTRVTIIKYFPLGTYNLTKKETRKYIDKYVKIKAGNGYYYVRESGLLNR